MREDFPPEIQALLDARAPEIGAEHGVPVAVAPEPAPDEQDMVIREVLAAQRRGEREFIVAGPAGTGKTTLIKRLARRLRGSVWLLAPTNRAARRITEVTGLSAGTIHAMIYPRPDEKADGSLSFGEPRLLEGVEPSDTFIVDESSMVGEKLYTDLSSLVDGMIIWVGDSYQLPPVNEVAGPNLNQPHATLVQVRRQAAESPVLALATEIRTLSELRRPTMFELCRKHKIPFRDGSVWDVARWLTPPDTFAVAWDNATRKAVNEAVRTSRNYFDPLVPGERLVSVANHHAVGILNGDLIEVEALHASPTTPDQFVSFGPILYTIKLKGNSGHYYIPLDLIGADRSQFTRALSNVKIAMLRGKSPEDRTKVEQALGRVLHVDYGYCMTAHKLQGSQATNIVVAWKQDWLWKKDGNRFEDTRRWTYTAVTRAIQGLAFVRIP